MVVFSMIDLPYQPLDLNVLSFYLVLQEANVEFVNDIRTDYPANICKIIMPYVPVIEPVEDDRLQLDVASFGTAKNTPDRRFNGVI